ncbi:MAG TPA: ABC transporter ATP-binding protein, partial [Ktedonobacterales bacterium]
MPSPDSISQDIPNVPATHSIAVATASAATAARESARPRAKKFLSYYRPYVGLFLADMGCALVISAVTLILPLCARYVTKDLLGDAASHVHDIYLMGALMVALVGIHALCTMFVDYQGHLMGARMEGDMRRELFEHYQKLSFGFYDEERTGQLMTRITNDTFALAELYHHGPEDIVTTCLTVTGAFIILLRINVALTLIVFLFLPIMATYALYFNKRMSRALRGSKD